MIAGFQSADNSMHTGRSRMLSSLALQNRVRRSKTPTLCITVTVVASPRVQLSNTQGALLGHISVFTSRKP